MEAAAGSSSSNAPARRPALLRLRVGRCHCRRALAAPSSLHSRGVKRGRGRGRRRECADLGDDVVWLIGERVLAYDVADYVRFRAVCRSWRRCSVDPRAGSCLDPRFHPRRWVLFKEEKRATTTPYPYRRRFVNGWTGECIGVDLPELRDHKLLSRSCDGLLVLLHDLNHVRLLNPLTRQLTHLPPLASLVPRDAVLSEVYVDANFTAWGSGNAKDGSAFVLCFMSPQVVWVAKPGDACWKVVKYGGTSDRTVCSLFAGPF